MIGVMGDQPPHIGANRARAESNHGNAPAPLTGHGIRQILYASLSTAIGDEADLVGILQQSRHNNAIDGITGLLWSDGRSFLQMFEGPPARMDATFKRIAADPRHHSMTVILDRPIDKHEFGTWTMAHRRNGDPHDIYDAQMRRLLSHASEGVRAQFLSLIACRTAAPTPRHRA